MKPILQIIKAKDFFQLLVTQINHANSHILIQAMVIEFSHEMDDIIIALKTASARGVKIIFHIDFYSQMYTLDHINYLPFVGKIRKEKIQTFKYINREIIDDLKKSGVEFIYTNIPNGIIGKIFPVLGRNHTKITVIDSSAFIGGMNFSYEYVERADFMMMTTDENFVKILTDQFYKINNNVPKEDYKIEIDKDTQLLVDVGKMRKSIIYDTALSTIKKTSRNLEFISQLLPDFEMLNEIISLARKNRKISLITSSVKTKLGKRGVRKTITKRIEYFLFQSRSKGLLHPLFFKGGNGRVHAKLLIVDANTMYQIAIFGSHNYSKFGVFFGTNEIAVQTRDPLIINQLSEWFSNISELQSQKSRFLDS